eukprot:1195210-Prorocentrum_minimum.AAC.10
MEAGGAERTERRRYGLLTLRVVDATGAPGAQIADEVRADAEGTVRELRRLGLDVHVLSGDQPAAVQAVALRLGLPPANVHGGVKPDGKARFVREMQERGRKVAMVGDGVNDAAALAQVRNNRRAPIAEGEREHTRSGHQSQKGRENIPVAGTNRRRGERIYP